MIKQNKITKQEGEGDWMVGHPPQVEKRGCMTILSGGFHGLTLATVSSQRGQARSFHLFQFFFPIFFGLGFGVRV